MASAAAQSTRNCVSCGRSFSWDANVCPYCGHDYRVAMAPPRKEHGILAPLGGVFILLASLGYIVAGGLLAAGSTALLPFSMGTSAFGVLCGGIILVVGVIALLGGINAIQRKSFAMAIIGGILTLPTVLGLIGLILVAVSRDDFD